MATIGERMRVLREMNDLTQAELGRFLGYSAQTISQYELGKRNPDLEGIQKAADFFNVTTDYLTGLKNYTVRLLSTEELFSLTRNASRRIPVLRSILADPESDPIPKDVDLIDFHKGSEAEHKALIAKDDSMSPLILPGDTVIFRVQPTAATNDIVLVSVDKKEPLIRKIVRRKKLVSLIPLNANYQTLTYDKATFGQKRVWGIIVETRRSIDKEKM